MKIIVWLKLDKSTYLQAKSLHKHAADKVKRPDPSIYLMTEWKVLKCRLFSSPYFPVFRHVSGYKKETPGRNRLN